jgi:hypothetical protein
MRGCPESDLCFALESSSRAFMPTGDAAKIMAPIPQPVAVVIAAVTGAVIIR